MDEAEKKLALRTIWKATHRDFKGMMYGERYILIYRNGTTSVPLSSLTDEEIASRLPKNKEVS